MKELFTPKQVAQAIDVSESSLKRWCDRGLLKTVRTAGGHRRVALADVMEFLRTSGREIADPALLGLPSNAGHGGLALNRARVQLRDALIAGDVELCRRTAIDLHLAGRSFSAICDGVIAGAMHEIGERWECGEAEVYQERRGSMICLRIMAELRSMMPTPPANAPIAIGGAPECDPYFLPTTMVEIVLRQQGWLSQSLGARLPFETLAASIVDVRPAIFWLSVSHIEDAEEFIAQYQDFSAACRSKTAIVVGGRALTEPIRRQMEYAAFCDNMQHLESFSGAIRRSSAAANESKA